MQLAPVPDHPKETPLLSLWQLRSAGKIRWEFALPCTRFARECPAWTRFIEICLQRIHAMLTTNVPFRSVRAGSRVLAPRLRAS